MGGARRTGGRAEIENERKKRTGTQTETEMVGPSILTSKSHTPSLPRWSLDPDYHLHSPPSLLVGAEVQGDFTDQKQTEVVRVRRAALDLTTTTTLTLTQTTQTLTRTDRGGMILWPRRLGPSTSPMSSLLLSSPLLPGRPSSPHPERLSENSESVHLHMCLLWRFTTSGQGPSRSHHRPAITNTVTNTETKNENVKETESTNGRKTGRGRATGFTRKASWNILDSPSQAI